MNDKKESVKRAIDRYMSKQLGQSKPRRKNQAPEKELERRIMPYLNGLGIFANVVESKAVYSAASGLYLSGQAVSGFPDIVGCNNSGQFVAVELKAPGRRSTIRPAQRSFLMKVISTNGFACCCDSIESFSAVYSAWIAADSAMKKAVLINDLPKEKAAANDDDCLFD